MYPQKFLHVHIRLGGFHLILSFLGCFGYIMNASGLKEAFTLIYAENTVDKILNGTFYARAIRANFLVSLTLSQIWMSTLQLTMQETNFLRDTMLPKGMIPTSESESDQLNEIT